MDGSEPSATRNTQKAKQKSASVSKVHSRGGVQSVHIHPLSPHSAAGRCCNRPTCRMRGYIQNECVDSTICSIYARTQFLIHTADIVIADRIDLRRRPIALFLKLDFVRQLPLHAVEGRDLTVFSKQNENRARSFIATWSGWACDGLW